MRSLQLDDWPEMANAAGFVRGYSEIGLRVLYKVISDRRLFARITKREGAKSMITQASNQSAARSRIKLLKADQEDYRDILVQTDNPAEKIKIRRQIKIIGQKIYRLEYYLDYRKTRKYKDYHRDYMRSYRAAKKRKKESEK